MWSAAVVIGALRVKMVWQHLKDWLLSKVTLKGKGRRVRQKKQCKKRVSVLQIRRGKRHNLGIIFHITFLKGYCTVFIPD